MKKEEFVKRIPDQLQNKIGLKRFKISLIKCMSVRQVKLAKMLLEFKTKEIFENVELQNKERSVKYLKESLTSFLLSENIKNFDLINESVKKKINVITIQSIIEKAIEQQKQDYQEKLEDLDDGGVNVSIKVNSVLGAYNAILNSVNSFFGENYDINNLTYEIVEEYVKTINKTYLQHLKSIFNKAAEKNNNIINWFSKFNKTRKFKDINKKVNIFYFNEIQNILNNLKEEEKYAFLTLLYSGMRMEELLSAKVQDIKNNCFYFHDSKAYFQKIIPIHKNILEYINNKVKTLNNEDYLFFEKQTSKTRVNTIRYERFNKKACFKDIDKTLHKTRSTFITYVNYFKSGFYENDIKSLTHKLNAIDQKNYNATLNFDNLRKIINNIDLEKLNIIQEQIENYNYKV